MHVINNPDNKGIDCDFEQHGFILTTYNTITIPNFPVYRVFPDAPCDPNISTYVLEGEEINSEVIVYPNPTYDIVKVNTRNNDVRFLRLCDVSGRILQVLPMQVGEKEMSVGGYPDGVYVLQLMDEAGRALCTYKVEKQHRY